MPSLTNFVPALVLQSYNPELAYQVEFKDIPVKFSCQEIFENYISTVLTLISVTNLHLQSGLEKISQDFSSWVTFKIDEATKEVSIIGNNIEMGQT